MLLAGVVISQGRYVADLTAFLPNAPTKSQSVLISQLKEGVSSRLVMVAVSGGNPAERAAISEAMARQLRGDSAFRAVHNGETVDNPADREFVFGHRYLLSDRVRPGYFSRDGLEASLGETIDLLRSSLGLLAKDLFLRDPTGETVAILSGYERSTSPAMSQGVWSSRDGTLALLVVEIRASGSDTDAQKAALTKLRAAFDSALASAGAANPLSLRMSGSPVFAVNARDTIRSEAVRLSTVGSLIVVLLLALVYRSPRLVFLSMLPVVTGAVAGVAAVALGFDVVHGITLGFGVTLIGEAVDYSIYLLFQKAACNAGAEPWDRDVWPTVRLGILTSIIGFGALLTSSFQGLAQLGCYSVAGLIAAGVATRHVLPAMLPADLPIHAAEAFGHRALAAMRFLRNLRPLVWILAVLIAGALLYSRGHIWSHELSALMPIPPESRAFDSRLRAELGASDAGVIVVVQADSAESSLQAAEAAGSVLARLTNQGIIADFDSPSRYLPSKRMQRLRQAAIPEQTALRRALDEALANLPLRLGQLDQFMLDAEAARHSALLTPAEISGTSLDVVVRALLVKDAGRHYALLPLTPLQSGGRTTAIDTTAVSQALSAVQVENATVSVLDFKRESDAMYGAYLKESLRLVTLGMLAVVLLLAWRLGSSRVLIRVVAPLALSLLTVIGAFALAGHSLTLLHLVGLLLVVAIGSNYTLILQKNLSVPSPTAAHIAASLVMANLTAVIAFGVLATSPVPILSDIGSTVAPGVLLALLYGVLFADLPEVREGE